MSKISYKYESIINTNQSPKMITIFVSIMITILCFFYTADASTS